MLVPIRVQTPPRIEAKLNGISTFDKERLCRLAQSLKNGMNIATTGVLLITELTSATGAISLGRKIVSEVLSPNNFITHQCNAPLSRTAAETM